MSGERVAASPPTAPAATDDRNLLRSMRASAADRVRAGPARVGRGRDKYKTTGGRKTNTRRPLGRRPGEPGASAPGDPEPPGADAPGSPGPAHGRAAAASSGLTRIARSCRRYS